MSSSDIVWNLIFLTVCICDTPFGKEACVGVQISIISFLYGLSFFSEKIFTDKQFISLLLDAEWS